MRPYRNYSEQELASAVAFFELAIEDGTGAYDYYMKQLSLAEAEIAEREFENEY